MKIRRLATVAAGAVMLLGSFGGAAQAGTPAPSCGSNLPGYTECVDEITQTGAVWAEINDYGTVTQQKTVIVYHVDPSGALHQSAYNQCGPQGRGCTASLWTIGEDYAHFTCWEGATDAIGRQVWAHYGFCPHP